MAASGRLPAEVEQALRDARLASYRLDDRVASLGAVLEVNPGRVAERDAAELVVALQAFRRQVDSLREIFLDRGPLGKVLAEAEREGIEVGELPDRLPWFWWQDAG